MLMKGLKKEEMKDDRQLYFKMHELVEGVFRGDSSHALLEFVEKDNSQGGTLGGGLLFDGCLERLIGGCLAKDPALKHRAAVALKQVSSLPCYCDSSLLSRSLLRLSSLEDSGGGRSNKMAYARGRLMAAQSLVDRLCNDIPLFNAVAQLLGVSPDLQQQVIQLLFKLGVDQSFTPYLSEIQAYSQQGLLLTAILKGEREGSIRFGEEELNAALKEAQTGYPKESLALQRAGTSLHSVLQCPREYLYKLVKECQQGKEEVRGLFYFLTLLRGHLSTCEINEDSWKTQVDHEVMGCYFDQLRVQNKHVRSQAEKVRFHCGAGFQTEFLRRLREGGVLLSCVGPHHPLYLVYLEASLPELWRDLVSSTEHIEEVQLCLRCRGTEMSIEQRNQGLQLLISVYHREKQEGQLGLVWGALNAMVFRSDGKTKRRLHLQTALQLLHNINIDSLGLNQTQSLQLRRGVKSVLRIAKEKDEEKEKGEENALWKGFVALLLAVAVEGLVYPEEMEVLKELAGMKTQLLRQWSGCSKRLKIQGKQAVGVLVDIMISLLTRAPLFVRRTIQDFFDVLSPQLTPQHLQLLLQVLRRPDIQFIEDH